MTSWHALAVGVALAMGASAAKAVQIDVGYADTSRPSAFFPNPFFGDPSVPNSQGYTVNNSFDNGLIGVDNRSGTSTVIVDDSTFKYTINGGPSTGIGSGLFEIGAGQFGIIVLGNTSDSGRDISGVGYGTLASGCAGNGSSPGQASTCPTVTFGFYREAPITYFDSGHVLDTGGFDFGGDGVQNESFAWRPIGTFGGQSVSVPEPSTLAVLGVGLVGLGIAARRRPG